LKSIILIILSQTIEGFEEFSLDEKTSISKDLINQDEKNETNLIHDLVESFNFLGDLSSRSFGRGSILPHPCLVPPQNPFCAPLVGKSNKSSKKSTKKEKAMEQAKIIIYELGLNSCKLVFNKKICSQALSLFQNN
jgi:hypothetical protein